MPSSTRASPGTKETPSSCCTPCCVCCSCCIKPALIAALGLLDKEIDEIVAQKIVALAPTSKDMVRDTYSAPSKKGKSKVPKAPPLAKFEAWERAKAAIVVQKNYRGHAQKIETVVRLGLEKIPKEAKAGAIAGAAKKGGDATEKLDGISAVIMEHLGKNVWARAIFNAPNDWSEKQMVERMADVLANPSTSPYLWVLTKPTKHERVLLGLSRTVASKREVDAAVKIQKTFRGRSKRLAVMVRFELEGMPAAQRATAAKGGLTAIGELISEAMGKNVWNRAVLNAPDEWEEEQMLFAMRDVLANPGGSCNLWLLSKPTKHERRLLTAFKRGGKAINAHI